MSKEDETLTLSACLCEGCPRLLTIAASGDSTPPTVGAVWTKRVVAWQHPQHLPSRLRAAVVGWGQLPLHRLTELQEEADVLRALQRLQVLLDDLCNVGGLVLVLLPFLRGKTRLDHFCEGSRERVRAPPH